ncbi:HAMP domain-containing protein [Oceanispirochaeta crateris]|uniref:HAMP domain-containing protein n=1 Tax=Oceanispirochaeta crateris TaxID=2518645 RepID=A0A5C1QNH3_9SPIO|nr:methyl-accepting chemotaxis protein [Oceanispirochaeta crateris]QEN09645.1 HAMP domain-containing protein [Oceanispirochaeta crateris]
MKIRTKLMTLIFSLITAMVLSLSIFILLQNFIGSIEKEKSILLEYKETIQQQHIELYRFLMPEVGIQEQLAHYETFIQKADTLMEEIKELTILPNINDDILQSLDSIISLKTPLKLGFDTLLYSFNTLIDSYNNSGLSIDGVSLNEMAGVTSSDVEDIEIFNYHRKSLVSDISDMGTELDKVSDTISEQYDVIEGFILYFSKRSFFILLLLVAIILTITIISALVVANKIAHAVGSIRTSVTHMEGGDLTRDFSSKLKDETRWLSDDMNTFQEGLRNSLKLLKNLSIRNTDVKEELISTATETSAAAVEISANIQSINKQITSLDENISTSKEQITGISGYTGELNSFIQDQIAMVEQSTASITQMIASISNIYKLTEKNKEAMNSLVETAREGGAKLTETTQIIEEVNASVSQITGMTNIIQNISEQTNLLAMNAAIEAAHAGEHGKGFAVVSDEIRKLAEASSVNSKEISKTLERIILIIHEASESGLVTKEAFDKIDRNVHGASEALLAISSSMPELNMGGKQILDAMSSLSETSSLVQEKSGIIKNDSESITEMIGQVSDISGNVSAAVSEINSGFSEVVQAVEGLKQLSDEVGSVSIEIDKEVNHFVTEKGSNFDQ